MDKRVKSLDEVLAVLSEHLEQLRPSSAPTQLQINAAKTTSAVVDSYLAAAMTALEYCKAIDVTPDYDFLRIKDKPGK